MRIDKLTTTFQEALADAQSLAVTSDNPYIEPAHVLAAMLAQADGPKALLARAGVNVGRLQTGARRRDRQACRRCRAASRCSPAATSTSLLQAAEKEASKRGDQFIASEMFLLAAGRRQERRSARSLQGARRSRASRSRRRSTRCAAARRSTAPRPKASARR